MKVSFSKKREGLDLNKTVYICFTCKRLFNWDGQSSWYGSDKDMEEHPEKIKYFCSDKCKDLTDK
jgi:DNA-directed RNA polymerase subunit RPC12/RpoP